MNGKHESLGHLVACIFRSGQKYFDRKLHPLGLSSGVLPVLMNLLHHDSIQQQELSKIIHVDKATITRAIPKLIAAGYVRRDKDPDDNRAYRLFITDKARDRAQQLRTILASWTSLLEQGMSAEDRTQVRTLLKLMRNNALQQKEEHTNEENQNP